MKKVICLILASLFYLLGIIGLLIPIIPQIPFFIIGTIFMIIGFKSFKTKIRESEFYKKHIQEIVCRNKFFKKIFYEEK